ncbi:MAG: HAD family hydrolase [Candidatus Thorarchaeota archaeon]|nr:MAG: HAD family hydrolase [Candidatus Thorarchaeota archaeon]
MVEKIHCKAVIFDFDGTLADSMPFLESIGVEMMMKYFGVSKEDATHRYRSTTGLPYEQQVKMNFPDHPKCDLAINEFEKLKKDRIFDQQLFEDTEDTVRKLNEMGLDIFVSSSTFQPTIEEYFQRLGILDLFTGILGYRPGFEKGADHFNHINSKYNIQFDDILFVGDSLMDYERTQGFCKFIGILGMFSSDDFKSKGHSGHLVQRLSEILSYIVRV